MESSQDKDLPASERKLQKARTDGQAARSRDLSHLAILGTGAVCMFALAPDLFAHLELAIGQALRFDATAVHTTASMLSRLQDMLSVGLIASAIFALATASAALISAIGAGGWGFSAKPITPQFKRLNPISWAAHLLA